MMVENRIRLIPSLGFIVNSSRSPLVLGICDMMAAMKFFVCLHLILISLIVRAQAGEGDCADSIQNHLKEAIEHNKKMLVRYGDLTEGRSTSLSATLISLEKMSALMVKNIDQEARIYRENGVPLLCEEIPAMSTLPEFQEKLSEPERPKKLYKFSLHKLSSALKGRLHHDDFEGAYNTIKEELNNLESAPNQMCLTRHFLESIAATLKFSDKHREEAKDLNLSDPRPIIKKFLDLEIKALLLTQYLDHRAFPLQKEGLLIFCQDVPAISWK